MPGVPPTVHTQPASAFVGVVARWMAPAAHTPRVGGAPATSRPADAEKGSISCGSCASGCGGPFQFVFDVTS